MNELINLIFELQYFKDGILTLTVLDIKLEALVTVLKMESIVLFSFNKLDGLESSGLCLLLEKLNLYFLYRFIKIQPNKRNQR